MNIKVELVKVEAEECEGELSKLTFETEVDGLHYQYQLVIIEPSDTNLDYIDNRISSAYESWVKGKFNDTAIFV